MRGGGAARHQFADARHLALEELLARVQFLQLRLRLAVVEPREHITLGDGLALAEQMSMMRSRTTLVTLAQRTGSTVPVA